MLQNKICCIETMLSIFVLLSTTLPDSGIPNPDHSCFKKNKINSHAGSVAFANHLIFLPPDSFLVLECLFSVWELTMTLSIF